MSLLCGSWLTQSHVLLGCSIRPRIRRSWPRAAATDCCCSFGRPVAKYSKIIRDRCILQYARLHIMGRGPVAARENAWVVSWAVWTSSSSQHQYTTCPGPWPGPARENMWITSWAGQSAAHIKSTSHGPRLGPAH